jgi:hypothetical protein
LQIAVGIGDHALPHQVDYQQLAALQWEQALFDQQEPEAFVRQMLALGLELQHYRALQPWQEPPSGQQHQQHMLMLFGPIPLGQSQKPLSRHLAQNTCENRS